jgi:hypothetical protein
MTRPYPEFTAKYLTQRRKERKMDEKNMNERPTIFLSRIFLSSLGALAALREIS